MMETRRPRGGVYWGNIRVILGVYWDNGKENGHDYVGFRVILRIRNDGLGFWGFGSWFGT